MLYGVDFTSSDLSRAAFCDIFGIVTSVAFSSNGILLAAGDAYGQVRIWDVANDQPILMLEGHKDAVWSVAFSLDSSMLANGSSDKTVRLWNVSSTASERSNAAATFAPNQAVKILEGHDARVQSVVFSPDNQFLASCSEDHTIRVWDARTGLLRRDPAWARRYRPISSLQP